MNIIGQVKFRKSISKVLEIFNTSDAKIRPHCMITGESGSGKTHIVSTLCKKYKLNFVEVNAAQLTKEGVSGNSLSKALTPLLNAGKRPTVVFVDEFDKLIISNNSNDSHAHESTVGVQNEFLKVLESDTTQVFGDYGKYITTSVANVLFVFAGAFNGEENITIDRLRQIGLKTEFLGRVPLVFNTEKLSIEDLFAILESSDLLESYLDLFPDIDKEKCELVIKGYLRQTYEMNTLGARHINSLIHQYFVYGGILPEQEVIKSSFQNKLKFGDN